MGSPLYGWTPGPLRVTSEKPEVRGYAIVCCGFASGQMAARHVKPDLPVQMEETRLSAHRARALRGRPHNNGANAAEVRAGTWDAMGVRLTAASLSGVLAALKAGKAAVYCHEYGLLPAYLRHQSGTFGHSAALCYYRRTAGVDYVGWFDPLAAQGSRGLWARWSDLGRAAWGGAQHSVTSSGAPVAPGPVPPGPTPPDPVPPQPPVEPPTDPIPPVVAPDPTPLPYAALWPGESGAWGRVAWPAPPPPPPAPPPRSWWGRSPWQPAPGASWGAAVWGPARWSSGRW